VVIETTVSGLVDWEELSDKRLDKSPGIWLGKKSSSQLITVEDGGVEEVIETTASGPVDAGELSDMWLEM
jgi:hypothetical protein